MYLQKNVSRIGLEDYSNNYKCANNIYKKNIKYFQIMDSTYDNGMDTIFQFEHAAGGGHDRIDLSSIDAVPLLGGNQAFQFVGSGNFSMFGGSVRVTTVGGNSIVMVNTDSDAIAEMVILVDGVTGLTADDFIL